MFRSMLTLRRFFGSKVYTKSHEWVNIARENGTAKVGITNYAQEQLGQIIHIEFPTVGKKVEVGQSPLVIESVKLAADVYSPIAGQIVAINSQVEKNPTLVNDQAEDAWLFEVKYDKEPENTLTAEEYKKEIDG